MSDKLEKIKAKIRALSAKTSDNGCTEAEAQAALQKVAELLAEYNLTMSEVDLNEEKVEQRKFTWGTDVQYISGVTLMAVATFCNCKVWYDLQVQRTTTVNRVSRSYRVKNVKSACYFYGFEHDINMAEYLYNLLNKSIFNETVQFKKGEIYQNSNSRKTAYTAFQHGMNTRLTQRLYQLHRENNERYKTSSNNTLVLVKNAKIEEGFKDIQTKWKLKSTKEVKKYKTDHLSYGAGKDAGEKVNLNRPVENKEKTLQITKI